MLCIFGTFCHTIKSDLVSLVFDHGFIKAEQLVPFILIMFYNIFYVTKLPILFKLIP